MRRLFKVIACGMALSIMCACSNSLVDLNGNSDLTSIGDAHKITSMKLSQEGYLGVSSEYMFDIPSYSGLSEIKNVSGDYVFKDEDDTILYLVNTGSYRIYRSNYLPTDIKKIGEYSPSEVSELLFLEMPTILCNSGIISDNVEKERVEETFEQKVISSKEIAISGYSGVREVGSFRFSLSDKEESEYQYAGYFLNDERKSPESWVVIAESKSDFTSQDLQAIVDYTAENVKVN